MRHQIFGKKLNRDIKERKALFKSLILALISYGKIKTSLAKAKAIQRLVDKMVTKVKDGSDSTMRQVSSFLTSREAVSKLVKEIAPRFAKITGGYSRLRRIGQRAGDATEEVILEWSIAPEKKEVSPAKLEEKKTKKIEDTVKKVAQDKRPKKKTTKK